LAADGLLKKLETLGKPEHTANIKATRINKVLKAAIRSSHVPADDHYHLKKRMHKTMGMYNRTRRRRCRRVTGAGDPVDGADDTISLPNTSPETFANFVRWLYQHKVESSKPSADGTYPSSPHRASTPLRTRRPPRFRLSKTSSPILCNQ
jgi:hypothetical protein